ncbi:alpha/beta hydrolase [Sinomicrobium kalidii]|nr:alpha/beta hydrolase [Sinomicrobium kalidii]
MKVRILSVNFLMFPVHHIQKHPITRICTNTVKVKVKKILKFFIFSLLLLSIAALLFVYIEYRNSNKPNKDIHKADNINWVETEQGYIHIRTFGQNKNRDSTSLVFVIHGDAPFNKPGYQNIMAEKIASGTKNTVAVAILRPGYTDPQDHTSNGIRGLTTGDNYTPEVIEAVSEVIEKLKKKYNPSRTLVIGHSGGAAITGNLIGLKPGLTDVAVLVSCPCDVAAWRAHMRNKQPLNPFWYLNVKSISPVEVVKNIGRDTEIMVISGENDKITPLKFSRKYYEALTTSGLKASFISLPDEGHEILLNSAVTEHIKSSIHPPQ